jgi:hypothetical protein
LTVPLRNHGRRLDGLTYDEYAALPGLRSSGLHRLAMSPLHYHGPQPERRGGAGWLHLVHSLVLEPLTVPSAYAVYPGRRAGKVWDEYRAANEGRTIVTTAEYTRAAHVAAGVYGHPVAAALMDLPGHSEVTITWYDETHLVDCQARLDRYAVDPTTGRHIIIDLKTYGTSDPRVIGRRAAQLGAHVQAAHYRAAVESLGVPPDMIDQYLIVAEHAAPYDVAVVELTRDHAIHLGETERQRLLALLAECQATDTWPGRCPAVEPLILPAWTEGDDDLYLTGDEQ